MNALDFPVRHSRLKNMAKSPAHYLHALADVDGAGSAAQQLGTAIHSLVLGGAPVLAFPGATRRGKEWDAFKADNLGSTIVTKDELETAHAVHAAIQADPNAVAALTGMREYKKHWSIGGRACVSTLDVYQPGSHITDLKTCRSAHPRAFARDARRFHYDSQLAFYDDAVGGVPDHYIVAAETVAPYPVTVFRLTPATIEMGRALYRSWWEWLMGCEENNFWPGYSRLIESLDLADNDGLDWGES
jgi:hypothetical protein